MFVATALAMLGTNYVYDSIGPVAGLLSQQLGLSDLQIGSLNAIYSLPNIFLPLMGGVLVDRFGARTVVLWTAIICLLGASLTVIDGRFPVMLCGRLLFGVGAETLQVSIIVALSQWFLGGRFALFFTLNLSLARCGSYLADRSPSFARSLYERGWQPPLWIAAAFAALSLAGAIGYWMVDRRREAASGALGVATPATPVRWREALRFRAEYWYIAGLLVSFYSVVFPFRSTFAIKYFEQARGVSLEEASRMNSYVFMAAIFATPAFGYLVDRVGRHSLLLAFGSLLLPLSFLLFVGNQHSLWIPNTLLGLSYSLVPAVLWPAVARYVTPDQRGTAYGLLAMLQNAGLTLTNVFVGYLNDRAVASAVHPEGYAYMLWFFCLLGLTGFVFAIMLKVHGTTGRPH
jgi:MFS family permease